MIQLMCLTNPPTITLFRTLHNQDWVVRTVALQSIPNFVMWAQEVMIYFRRALAVRKWGNDLMHRSIGKAGRFKELK